VAIKKDINPSVPSKIIIPQKYSVILMLFSHFSKTPGAGYSISRSERKISSYNKNGLVFSDQNVWSRRWIFSQQTTFCRFIMILPKIGMKKLSNKKGKQYSSFN